MVRTKTAGIRCIQWKWGRTKGKRRRRFCTLFFQPSLWCHTRHRLRRREAINDLNNNAALCIPCHTLACLPLRGLSHTVSASTAYLPHAATPSCSCPPVSSLTLSNPFLPLSLPHPFHRSSYLSFSLHSRLVLLTWCLHSWLIHCVPISCCRSIPFRAPRGVAGPAARHSFNGLFSEGKCGSSLADAAGLL